MIFFWCRLQHVKIFVAKQCRFKKYISYLGNFPPRPPNFSESSNPSPTTIAPRFFAKTRFRHVARDMIYSGVYGSCLCARKPRCSHLQSCEQRRHASNRRKVVLNGDVTLFVHAERSRHRVAFRPSDHSSGFVKSGRDAASIACMFRVQYVCHPVRRSASLAVCIKQA